MSGQGSVAASEVPPQSILYLQVQTTTDSRAEAMELAREAVEERLAACAQVAGPIASMYWWEDGIERADVKFLAGLDALLLECLLNGFRHVAILRRQELVVALDERDTAAEAAEHLRELDADVAAAEDQELAWELVLLQERAVVEESMLRQPFDGGDGRA